MAVLPIGVAQFAKNSRAVVRIRLDVYRGQPVLDVRVWYPDGSAMKPGRAGITMSLAHLPSLCGWPADRGCPSQGRRAAAMRWQATAWAEKQKTGSPARKVLLLVLANYADATGRCRPSQATLAEGTEQSIDTVQRQLRKLEADGHIRREKRVRAGGHWPGHRYILNMHTEPQIAARSKSDLAMDSAATGPQRARPPGRKLCGMNHQRIISLKSQCAWANATIASGAIDISAIRSWVIRVVSESGTSDDLATITHSGVQKGDRIILRAETSHTITIQQNTGNIQLSSAGTRPSRTVRSSNCSSSVACGRTENFSCACDPIRPSDQGEACNYRNLTLCLPLK
jgi:hypothetical protein